MYEIRKALDCSGIRGTVVFGESMSRHTTFRVGGPADIFIVPQSVEDLQTIYAEVSKFVGMPVFVLGAGANVLVADRGIRGIVIDMRRFSYCVTDATVVRAGAGTPMSAVCEHAAARVLSGLEFIYGMPGSVGGSVWMNARCYEESISGRLAYVDVVTESDGLARLTPPGDSFAYKQSPFQKMQAVIVEAGFALSPGRSAQIREEMAARILDRQRKGHYRAPSVGSIFKNNRAFGQPTGKIIDSVGLKGRQVGGARVADYHANIIINTGEATADDILALMQVIEAEVSRQTGFVLDREVLLVGDWQL